MSVQTRERSGSSATIEREFELPPLDGATSRPRGTRWGKILRQLLSLAPVFLLGTLIGAAALAGFQAYGVVAPPPLGGDVASRAETDLELTIREPYLSRVAAQHVASAPSLVPLENVRVNVLPGDRLRVLADVPFMGQRFQATALMSVGVAERQIRVQVQDARLGTLLLPLDLEALFAQPINRELATLTESAQFDVMRVKTAEDRLVISLAARPGTGGPR